MSMSIDLTQILAWSALLVGYFLAVLGTIVPGLPGAIFIVVGVLVHKFLMPQTYSWTTIGILIFLALGAWAADFVAGLWGAKWGGASRSGLWGAAIGGVLGLPFGFLGLILGPFIGAIVGDLYERRRDLRQLLRSGSGAALGIFLSLAVRFVILLVMGLILIFGAIF